MAFVSGSGRVIGGSGLGERKAVCSSRRAATVMMAVTVKKEVLPGSQVGLEITVPAEDAKKAYDKYVQGLVKQSNMPGFRKGSAPKQLIINAAGKERIAAGVVEQLVESSAKEAMEAEGISAVGQSSLDSDVEELINNFSEKNEFVYKLKVDVWPTPEFNKDWKERSITVEQEPFDESLLDDALEEFRRREATYVATEEDVGLEMGDQAVANMQGFYEAEDGSKGEPLPDFAEGQGIDITLEEGKFMPGFVEGLVGAKVNETRAVPVQFPETARKELSGLKAIFDVEVLEVRNRVLPELNDELALTAAGKKDLAELREDLKSRLSFEVDQANDAAMVKAMEDELAGTIEVDLPESLIDQQTRTKFAAMMSDFKQSGASDEQVQGMITKENYAKYAKTARGNVETMLKKSFAIQLIADEEGVTIEDEEVDAQLDLLRAELKEELDEESARDKVFANLQRNAVVEILKNKWTIATVDKQPPAEEPEEE
uniref:peptidylprolyl isomerase n=1 Tax=Rhodosorus marinus TaxID=101924 RepID=A0A7S3E751_9RHOD|mmetsp:Transcript_13391/g.53683  ORF Transcript_13391/g.53683 Transcript_13391/m.53683 type:complete len:486 (+) Transcript_13391:167-1624(+)